MSMGWGEGDCGGKEGHRRRAEGKSWGLERDWIQRGSWRLTRARGWEESQGEDQANHWRKETIQAEDTAEPGEKMGEKGHERGRKRSPLCMTVSRSIHISANGMISFCFMAE